MDEVTRLAHDSVATASGADCGRFAPGALLAGRFRIVAPLGRGGMGEVYRAEDLKLGQTVALKFLPEHLSHDPVRLAQFHNEVRVARTISHRNVCRITDFGLASMAGSVDNVRSGTPAYMAPEQLAGREVTARSDIYALGLVLFELFTGN